MTSRQRKKKGAKKLAILKAAPKDYTDYCENVLSRIRENYANDQKGEGQNERNYRKGI